MSLMEREEFGIEKIIQVLQEAVDLGDAPKRGPFGVFVRKEYLAEAIALLRTHPDNQPNEPLTLEKLKEMDRQSVWVYPEREWAIVDASIEWVSGLSFSVHFSDYGSWLAYFRPPKET